MGKAIAAAPLMFLPVAAYNILALVLGGDFTSTLFGARLTAPVFELRTLSGGLWPVSLADLLLTAALIVMFVELVKSTRDRRVALINHALSIVVFVICLAELLLAAAFATSTFFLITLMVLLDVLAGFIVTLVILRRESGVKTPRP
jgi:hypothetical protein